MNKSPIWRDIAKRLEKSRKNWAYINVGHLERHAKKDETIIIPGKLLGAGRLKKPLTVAAFSHSSSAATKVAKAGGKLVGIRDLLYENPNGTNIRVMGK